MGHFHIIFVAVSRKRGVHKNKKNHPDGSSYRAIAVE